MTETNAPPVSITVTSLPGLTGKTTVASILADLLHFYTGKDILFVGINTNTADPPMDTATLAAHLFQNLHTANDRVTTATLAVPPSLADHECNALLATIARNAEGKFAYIVFDFESSVSAKFENTHPHTNIVIPIVDAPDLALLPTEATIYPVINLFNKTSTPLAINACTPFVLPKDDWFSAPDTTALLLPPATLSLQRLARKILGKTVGLALGGTGACALSHIGVLQVFEEHGISVDMLAGSSLSAMVAGGYAAGLSAQRLMELAAAWGQRQELIQLFDFSLFGMGFFAGERYRQKLIQQLEDRQDFKDLLRPCRINATDLSSGEAIALGDGKLADALRASTSVPILVAPFNRGDQLLVDGGVSQSLPVNVLQDMGADICIAVNAYPRLNPSYKRLISSNLIKTFANTLQILQNQLGTYGSLAADVQIAPDLGSFSWLEFYRTEEIIEKGRQAAINVLPDIRARMA